MCRALFVKEKLNNLNVSHRAWLNKLRITQIKVYDSMNYHIFIALNALPLLKGMETISTC